MVVAATRSAVSASRYRSRPRGKRLGTPVVVVVVVEEEEEELEEERKEGGREGGREGGEDVVMQEEECSRTTVQVTTAS